MVVRGFVGAEEALEAEMKRSWIGYCKMIELEEYLRRDSEAYHEAPEQCNGEERMTRRASNYQNFSAPELAKGHDRGRVQEFAGPEWEKLNLRIL